MSEKNKRKFPHDYEELREEIIKYLEISNPQQAYSTIRQVLDYPSSINNEAVWEDAIKLFERIARGLGGDNLGNLVQKIVENPNNVDNLYNLAYQLYEQKVHGIAATFLNRANKIQPQKSKIVTELVSNLEILLLNNEARHILLESKDLVESDEFCRYLLAYNSIMVGDVDTPFKILPTIQNSSNSDIQYMAKALEAMLDRFSALKKIQPLDNKDLRGWHLVLNGSILLHLSPFGLNEGMNGRYAYISDSYSLCRHGIERIKEVLKVAEIDIPNIISLPDHSSRILGMATSKILQKPFRIFSQDDIQSKGLIVAYDLDGSYSEEMYNLIKEHRPGQILWAHATYWIDPFPVAPDLTTYLYQQNNAPWGSHLGYDKDLKKVIQTETDSSQVEELARRIIDAEIDEEYLNDLDELLSIIKPLKNLKNDSKPGIFRINGKRIRQRAGSPVKSSRFI